MRVKTPATAAGYAKSDAAGESFNSGTDVVNKAIEPTGPNTPLLEDSNGNQVYPGPGDNAFIDRPATLSGDPANDPKYILRRRQLSLPVLAPTRNGVSGGSGSDVVTDPSITAPDAGRAITGDGHPRECLRRTGDRCRARASTRSAAPPRSRRPTNPANKAYIGTFEVVDCTSNAVDVLTGAGDQRAPCGGDRMRPTRCSRRPSPTPGGGDTGSVLISPLIKPGTVSTVGYNHYSWLRTMEDLFKVAKGQASPHPGWRRLGVARHLDGLGHLGFAAQPNLRTFGSDVFTNVRQRRAGRLAYIRSRHCQPAAAAGHARSAPPDCSPL